MIVAGSTHTYRTLGWAVDFCLICRGLSPHRVEEVRRVLHVEHLPLGRGKAAGYRTTCGDCRLRVLAERVPFAAYVPSADMDLVEMAVRTAPDASELWAERMDLEERALQGGLTPDERRMLILEPFTILGSHAQNQVKRGQIPTGAGLAIIGLVFLTPVAILVWMQPGRAGGAEWALRGVIVALLATLAVSWRTGGARWVRRRVHPLLVRALAPLGPSAAEVEWAIGELRKAKAPLATRINTEWLMEDLTTARAAADSRAL